MEGLFRNGINPSYQKNIVSVNVSTEQMFKEEKRNAVYAKLIFFLKNTKNADLLQIIYHNKNMDASSIIRVSHVKNVSTKIGRDGNKNRMLLFALFEMFFLNKSTPISILLKKINPSFAQNKEILNKNNIALYRKYLRRLRQQNSNSETTQNNFDFETEKKKVGSFYRREPSVKLVKMAEQFFWKIDMQSIQALFTNEKHQLKKISLNLFGEQVHIGTSGFGIFSKDYELPKVILFENQSREKFLFTTLRLKNLDGNNRYMDRLVKKYMNYEEKFKKNKFKIKALLKDSLKFYY